MDSDEDNTSSDSRKRGRVEEKGKIFDRSRKLTRTPIKQNDECKIDQLLIMLQNLTTQTKELTTEVKDIKNEQREYRKELMELRKEMNEIKQNNLQLKTQNECMKREIKLTKEKVEQLEKEKKANNVIMQGLPIQTTDSKQLKEDMIAFMREELGIEAKIEEVYKLGYKTCLIKMENSKEKDKIMENKNKLKTRKREIYINNDMTKEERKIQQEIRKIAKIEKSKGKTVRVGYQKVTMDGVVWKWNKEKEILEEVKLTPPKN